MTTERVGNIVEKPFLAIIDPLKTDTQRAINSANEMMPLIEKQAEQVAKARKIQFDAYVAEGFTKDQALSLCRFK